MVHQTFLIVTLTIATNEPMLWWEDLHILDFLGGPNFLMFYPFVKPCAWKYAVVWKHVIKTTETKGLLLSFTHKNTDLKFEERKCEEFWNVLRRWKYKTKQTPPFFGLCLLCNQCAFRWDMKNHGLLTLVKFSLLI